VEVAEIEGCEDQDEPEEARCGRERRGRGEFVAGWGHGKRSLALSVYLGRLEVQLRESDWLPAAYFCLAVEAVKAVAELPHSRGG
jgi:hypothetical protein